MGRTIFEWKMVIHKWRNNIWWRNQLHQDHRIENFRQLYTQITMQMGKTSARDGTRFREVKGGVLKI